MAGTRQKRVTMQGVGTPVSATGQGEKAGPQASLSCNRSSALVGDLASVEYTASRKLHGDPCKNDPNIFCYVCGEFVVKKNRRKINDKVKSMYEECFGSKILGETIEWVPNCICEACCIMFTRWLQNKDKSKLLFSVPVRWSKPQSKKDCYFCQTNVEGIRQSSRRTIVYPNVKSVLKPQYTGSVFENRNDSTEF